MTHSRSYSAALVQMHVATVLFGMSAIFGKLVESSPSVLVCGRAVFGVVALGLVCGVRHGAPWRQVTGRGLAGLMGGGVLLTLHYVTFFKAIQVGGVAVGTLGFACFPAFVTLVEALAFREWPKRHEYALIALVTAGLVLITPSFSLHDQGTEGLLWGVASGAVYSILAVANRFTASRVSGAEAAWWQNLAMLVCLVPFSAQGLADAPAMDWLWFACLGLLCTALAYTLFVNSLTVLKARLAALIIALEPVYAIVMAWAVFHETPGPRMIAGGALILGAVVWAGRR